MSEFPESVEKKEQIEKQEENISNEVKQQQQNVQSVEKQEGQEANFDDFGDTQEEREEIRTENDFEGYNQREEEKSQENEVCKVSVQNLGLKTEVQHSQVEEPLQAITAKVEVGQAPKQQQQRQKEEEAENSISEPGQVSLKQNNQKNEINNQIIEGQKQKSPDLVSVSEQKQQSAQAKVSSPEIKQSKKYIPSVPSHQSIPSEAIETINHSAIIKQAQSQRIASIYTQFNNYNSLLQKTITSYKIIVNNVISELLAKKDYKKHLQTALINYFDEYSKIHRQFHSKASKLPKEQETASINKFINVKQELRKGYDQLFYLRRHIGVDAHKLDSYINTYIIKSIKKVFQEYREEVADGQRRQLQPKDQFSQEDKKFKKIVENLEKICKKGRQGVKYKDDVFVELVRFSKEQKQFKQALVAFGKSTLALRKGFIVAEKKLFENLTKVLNEFKNEQKIVYTAAKQFNHIQNYVDEIEEATKFERLCTITDVDYIKGVMELSNRKEKIEFKNKHFEEYLQMPFFERVVGDSKILFKGAIKKSFPLKKKNHVLVHTISHKLVEFDKQKSECLQVYEISQLNANIVGQGLVMLQLMSGLIFRDIKSKRLELQDEDRAHELIGYLNETEQIKHENSSKH